jgi:hypothetical protein
MKHLYIRHIIVFFLVFSHLFLFGQDDDARDIFVRATDQLLTENLELVMDMKVTDNKGRVKEKGYEIIMTRFGDVLKTKMSWLKPEQAKGTTVVFTEKQGETGLVEVFTPSNGKIRKLKATQANMDRVGSEMQVTNLTARDPDDLAFMFLPPREVDGNNCYTVVVKDNDFKDQARGELLIEMDSYRIVRIAVFDMYGKQVSSVKLSDFQAVPGTRDKIQPMRIVSEDLRNQKISDMQVLKIASRTDLTESDFELPRESK